MEYEIRTNIFGESSVRTRNFQLAPDINKHTPIFDYVKLGNIKHVVFLDFDIKFLNVVNPTQLSANRQTTLFHGTGHFVFDNCIRINGSSFDGMPVIDVIGEILYSFKVYDLKAKRFLFGAVDLGTGSFNRVKTRVSLTARHTIEDLLMGWPGFDFKFDVEDIIDLIKSKLVAINFNDAIVITPKFGNEAVHVSPLSEVKAINMLRGDMSDIDVQSAEKRAEELVAEHMARRSQVTKSALGEAHACLEFNFKPSFSSGSLSDSLKAMSDYFLRRIELENVVKESMNAAKTINFEDVNIDDNGIFSSEKFNDWNCLYYAVTKELEEFYPESNFKEGKVITANVSVGKYVNGCNAIIKLHYPQGFVGIDDLKVFATDIIAATLRKNSGISERNNLRRDVLEEKEGKFKRDTTVNVKSVRLFGNEIIVICKFSAGITALLKHFSFLYGEYIFKNCFTAIPVISPDALVDYAANGIAALDNDDSALSIEVKKSHRNIIVT